MATGKFKVIYASYAKVIFKVIFAIFKMWLLENLKLYMHKVIYTSYGFQYIFVGQQWFYFCLYLFIF